MPRSTWSSDRTELRSATSRGGASTRAAKPQPSRNGFVKCHQRRSIVSAPMPAVCRLQAPLVRMPGIPTAFRAPRFTRRSRSASSRSPAQFVQRGRSRRKPQRADCAGFGSVSRDRSAMRKPFSPDPRHSLARFPAVSENDRHVRGQAGRPVRHLGTLPDRGSTLEPRRQRLGSEAPVLTPVAAHPIALYERNAQFDPGTAAAAAKTRLVLMPRETHPPPQCTLRRSSPKPIQK